MSCTSLRLRWTTWSFISSRSAAGSAAWATSSRSSRSSRWHIANSPRKTSTWVERSGRPPDLAAAALERVELALRQQAGGAERVLDLAPRALWHGDVEVLDRAAQRWRRVGRAQGDADPAERAQRHAVGGGAEPLDELDQGSPGPGVRPRAPCYGGADQAVAAAGAPSRCLTHCSTSPDARGHPLADHAQLVVGRDECGREQRLVAGVAVGGRLRRVDDQPVRRAPRVDPARDRRAPRAGSVSPSRGST